MKRTAVAGIVLAALGGCMSSDRDVMPKPDVAPWARGKQPGPLPGMQGPWGEPVMAVAPPPPSSGPQPRPPSVMLASANMSPMGGSGVVPAGFKGGSCPPGGCPPGMMGGPMMPPGMMPPGPGMMPPGMMPPGAGMPPPGVPGPMYPPGVVAAVGAITGPGYGHPPAVQRTSVRFAAPSGMKVSWLASGPGGQAIWSPSQVEVPGRYNFAQASIYRLKLTDMPNRPGLELYPTLEVVPANIKTEAFLAHSSVPITFTDEDLDQVTSGNYLVKVIYLPDPQYQDLATTDEIVSTRLEPGVDPVAEACKRGSILLVVRVGNIDLEAPNTPPLNAPAGQMGGHVMSQPTMLPPGAMVPPPPNVAPPGSSVPAIPTGNGPAPLPSGPVGKAPAKPTVQPVSYTPHPDLPPTAAQLAGQPAPAKPTVKPSGDRPWWTIGK